MQVDCSNFDSRIAELTECLFPVQELMKGMKLKLNPDKTDDKHTRGSLVSQFPVTFLQSSIMQEEEVKTLGTTFESTKMIII